MSTSASAHPPPAMYPYPPPPPPARSAISALGADLEAQKADDGLSLEWDDLAYVIKDKTILAGVSGCVAAGEMLAVMGPSGAGKSTLLDLLARRTKPASGTITLSGVDELDGADNTDAGARSVSAYVEQDDALLGVLTVRETVMYAARLSFPPHTTRKELAQRVDTTIAELGLASAAHQRLGTPVQRGVSGGQRRRTTLACALVGQPRVLVLDEPTSGLDSTAGREVLGAVKNFARRHGNAVVASVHQPNWESFALFDKLLLLAQGRTMYFGSIDGLATYLADATHGLAHPVPAHANPADHALDLTSTDFLADAAQRAAHVDMLAERWAAYERRRDTGGAGGRAGVGAGGGAARSDASLAVTAVPTVASEHGHGQKQLPPHALATLSSSALVPDGAGPGAETSKRRYERAASRAAFLAACRGPVDCAARAVRLGAHTTGVLMERNMVNYSRNVLAYGVRLGMYLGMGVLLATVWVNLAQTSEKVNDRLSVHFFSVAFLGFMSVAGIPAFLEERQVFVRERMNGLYGPGAYVLANSLCTLPYLFACAAVFAVLCYWSIGLHPGAGQFFRFLGILFLSVYAAESQSAVVAALIPVFVAALAIAAFLNGFWMCVGGYFIRAVNLPRFWYYWAHFIDYQTYAFDLLVVNDLRGLVFDCARTAAGACECGFPSSLLAQSGFCQLRGEDVLNALDIGGISSGLYAGSLVIIALIYRVMLYVVLLLKKR